jgi:hypothetical protein
MEDMNEFNRDNIERWEWTMMIMQPNWVSLEVFERVRIGVVKKKGNSNAEGVRYERYNEGFAVQTLYIGAYDDEAPVIAEMHTFIKGNGYQPSGKHHEIYLSDLRRTTTEKLQTILRQPIRQVW